MNDFIEYLKSNPSQMNKCAECLKFIKIPSTCKDSELLENAIQNIEKFLSECKEVGTPSKKFSKLIKSLKDVTKQNVNINKTNENENTTSETKYRDKNNIDDDDDDDDDGNDTDTELGSIPLNNNNDDDNDDNDENEMVIMKQTLIERQRSYGPEDSELLMVHSTNKSKNEDNDNDKEPQTPNRKRQKLDDDKKEYIVLFAGFTKFPELRSQLEKQITELGGTVRKDDESVTSTITHVVRPDGALSTRMLVAALFGAWVVGPSWVTASSAQKKFVDEGEYGRRFTEENKPLVGKKVVMHESYKDDPKFDGIFDTLLIRDAGKAEIVEFVKGVKCDVALVAKNVSADSLKELVETGARICTRAQFYKSLLP